MTRYSTTTTTARFLLLGDCHAIAVGRATKAVGIPFVGGPIGSASEFQTWFFDVSGGEVVFRKPVAEQRYRGFLSELDVSRLSESPVPLVTTFGFSVHMLAHEENWRIYQDQPGGFTSYFLSSQLFGDIVRHIFRDAISYYRHVRDQGVRILAVMAPQRIPDRAEPAIFLAAQDVMSQAVRELGVEVIDVRARSCDETGRLRPELCSAESGLHGNVAFGRMIVDELLARGL